MHFYSRTKIRTVLSLVVLAAILSAFSVFQVHSSQAASGDWPEYMHGNARSGYNNAETIINQTSAPNLKLKWTATSSGCLNSPGGPISISTQPVVSQSLQMIFWGSWDGCEHATDLNGNQVWATYIGQTTNSRCNPPTIGVASTATVINETIGGISTPIVLVGGGDANFYALNASTGALIWKTLLGTTTGSFIWSSPAVYNGSVYEGFSSQLDCPLVQGQFFQLNALTGAIQNDFAVVPNGCTGGSVWGSAALDTVAGTLYFATGNAGTCSQSEPYAVSLIELSLSNLAFVGSWQVPAAQQVFDSDFGSTPTLFQATINGVVQPLVGLENKNGIYYAFDRGNLSNGPAWQATIAVGEIYSPSAWNGKTLFVGGGWANISGTACQGASHTGSLRALDPATGNFLWQDCFLTGQVQGAVTLVPGVAAVGAGTALKLVATTSGKILFTYFLTSGVFFGSASISNGVLYIGDSKGNLYAFAP